MSLASIGRFVANLFGGSSSNNGLSLSSLLPFGSLIDSGIGLISGISNNIYDRQLQKTIFERDDTQLTRLMNEYKNNGLNPLLGLPGASVGNTKGFEPSQIQSNFAEANAQKMQLDSLKLQNKNMNIQNLIAREELKEKRLSNQLERELMRGKINAQNTHKQNFYKDYDLPFPSSGVEYVPQTEKEKLVRFVFDNWDDVKNKFKEHSPLAPVDNYVDEMADKKATLDTYVDEGKLVSKWNWSGVHHFLPNSNLYIQVEPYTKKYEVCNGPFAWQVKGSFSTLEEAYKFALDYED